MPATQKYEQLPLFVLPPPAWPCWFRPQRLRAGHAEDHRRRVAMGLHPTGVYLGPEGQTCRTCKFHYVKQYAGRYHKCRWLPDTDSRTSDIRVRWRACQRWRGKESWDIR